MKKIIIILIIQYIHSDPMQAQNYDEGKIPAYAVPDILVGTNNAQVKDVDSWENNRRAEVLELFRQNMYGRVPEFDYHTNYQKAALKSPDLDDKATREEVTITIANGKGDINIKMLLTLPKNSKGKVPVFVGLNFNGNQATHSNKEISITKNYVIGNDRLGFQNHQANEQSRGTKASSWPVDMILERGYGLATIHCGDIDPDFDDGFENGVHSLLNLPPHSDEWGTIAAWAWGLSRAMDYLDSDERVDSKRVAVVGHSRLGKAALWAGAEDPRFALVISNNSGCGGAALSRRRIGETVEAINSNFPHWFCKNFHQYNSKEDELPLDQHMLIALVAPRPVYVASATEDKWADPKGEYTSLSLASPVYSLYGFETFTNQEKVAQDSPINIGKQGYHIRTGKHALTTYDWDQYLKFADTQFGKD